MFSLKRQAASPPVPLAEAVAGIGHEALSFLTQQNLEQTPANYALAYRFKLDRRGLIAMAIDTILMAEHRLTQEDADRIMAVDGGRACATTEALNHVEDALRHQTLQLADLTAGQAVRTSEFGRDLCSGLVDLTSSSQHLAPMVVAMIERTRVAEAQLNAASHKIDSLREQMEAMRDDAQRDALTGLLNRRGVLHELASRKGSPLGLVALCDVDHFKGINDRFGHGVGDRVLTGVAASLRESVGNSLVARWGGEEFLILADEVAPDAAALLLERARKDLAARSFKVRETGEQIGAVTVSIGAVLIEGRDVDAAIESADRMLYEAKEGGRNRVLLDCFI